MRTRFSPDGLPKPPCSDTNPEPERVLIEIYRRMPAWQKLQQVSESTRMAEIVALADLRHRHPQASPHELKMRLATRRLGAELMRKVYGWDPDKEGD
jgi:hypothetical protein